MSLDGWTVTVEDEYGNGTYDASTDTLTAHGGSTYNSVMVKYCRDVVCCTSYVIGISTQNDHPGFISVKMRDSSTGTWTDVYTSSTFTKSYATPFTGTICFYANVYVPAYESQYDYGILDLNSSTINTSLAAPTGATISGNTSVAKGTPLSLSCSLSNTPCPPPTYSWDFGDGTYGTTASVSKTWSAGGQYIVTCTATNSQGSSTDTHIVTVTESPTAVFHASATEITTGSTIQLIDDSITGYPSTLSYEWKVNSETTPSGSDWEWESGSAYTDENPSVIFNSVGSYDVSLKVTNSTGNDTESKADYIHVYESTPPSIIDFRNNVIIMSNSDQLRRF